MSIPKQLNHYTIIEALGQGGMGEVYLAEDTRLHRKVAIKVLSGLGSTDSERRIRFEREARAVAALNHPSIVTIHSVEEANGVPFLTMELVEGKPLSTVIPAGGLPLDTLLRIGISISDAMASAHQRGITHRDLKPANVMVSSDGRVKVLDFGLAKLRETDLDASDMTRLPTSDLTGEGRIIGTVAYMSPEQAEGKAVDPRSDIFSLGVLLHEMATGERPFKGDTNVSVMSSILKDTPPSITDLNPRLPPSLAKIIRRSLAKDPSRRYQTATDLRNELEELKQEIDTAPTVLMATGRPPAGRSRFGSPLLIAAVVAALLVGAGAWYWLRGSRTSTSTVFELDRFNRLTTSGNALIAAMSPDGRYVAHIKNDGTLPGLWVRQTATLSDVQIVPPAEVRYDGVTFSPDGNYVFYVIYKVTGSVGTLFKVPVLGGPSQQVLEDIDSRVAFSPDHKQFAFVRGDPATGRNKVLIANVDGSGLREAGVVEPPDTLQLNAPAWSPDGRLILASLQSLTDGPHNACITFDVQTGKWQIVGGKWGFVNDVDWMPDGRSFMLSGAALGDSNAQLWQTMFPSGERRRITNDLTNYIGVAIAADGQSIATVQVENNSNIWTTSTSGEEQQTQIGDNRSRNEGLAGLQWTPDGRIVYSSNASGNQEIWIMNADGSNARQLTNSQFPALNYAVTGDGRYIVYQRVEPKGMVLHRLGLDGSDQKQLTTTGAEFLPVSGADGKWVYFYSPLSGQTRPFKVAIDGGPLVPLGNMSFRPSDVSPDGNLLLGVTWDEAGRRQRIATLSADGKGTHTLLDLVVVSSPLWFPDGRQIVYVDVKDGVPNVWTTDMSGKTPRQLTHFGRGNIYRYDLSPDGKRLAVSRGTATSDVVLLTRKSTAPQ